MNKALPAIPVRAGIGNAEIMLMAFAAVVSLLGIFFSYVLFFLKPPYAESLATSLPGRLLHRFWFAGWGFDWFYETIVVKPFLWIARTNREDFIDLFYLGIIWVGRSLNTMLSLSQNGKVRMYAAGIALGAVLAIAIMVFM